MEDLDRLGGLLLLSADRLDEGLRAALRLEAALDTTWRTSATSAGAVADALAPCRAACRAGSSVRDLRGAVRTAREGYADAESGVGAAIRAVSVVGGSLIGEGGPLVWAAAGVVALGGALTAFHTVVMLRAARSSPTPVGAGLRLLPLLRGRSGVAGAVGEAMSGPGLLPAWRPQVGDAEALIPGAAAFLRGALPGRRPLTVAPVQDTAGTLAAMEKDATVLLGGPTALVVSRVPGTRLGTPPTSAAEVLELVDEQYPARGGEPGSVAVQELTHADGSRSWVVAIPGTQEAVPAGANPADMRSNLELVAEQPDDISRLVEQAMRAAGIAPDEPVLIAGHSQGGIAAVSVAADSSTRSHYDVQAVLTAGSPVAGITLPAGVESLHLEHDQDAVPILDGAPNPDTRSRTTVVRDLTASADPRDRAATSLVDAHSLVAYERTATAAESWGDPSVQGYTDAAARVLGGAVSARTTVFQGVRVAP